MKPFLKELAEKMVKEHDRLDALTFVFPNRRAALYFEHHLATSLKNPMWAPRLFSIEEFFKRQSDLMEPDRLTLVYRLHQVYTKVMGREEAFDRFYFWGEMLLRDFDELDKYMVNASQLFKDLSKVKELDETFDYLTDEQKEFLEKFWDHFSEKESSTKEEFLKLWQKLPKVYQEFTKSIKKEGMGYEGMIHREVADAYLKKPPQDEHRHTVFAGFNALTKAEAVLISTLVKQGARIFWDFDDYYMSDPLQEAGQFMRQYRDHSMLSSTFKEVPPAHIKNEKKNIQLTGVPLRIGQAKLAGEKVAEIMSALPKENLAAELAKTVIVLPDEGLLLPVLHSLPEELQDINVTMGFPLRETPLFSLLDLMVEMQLRKGQKTFSHREVTAILGHAYFLSLAGDEAEELRTTIVNRNRVYVSADDLKGKHEILEIVFKGVEAGEATSYLLNVVKYLGASFTSKQNFDREYAYHFYQHLSRLESILEGSATIDWRGYQKLFRQVIQSQRIPFSGEPLRGLQIMGVLETRNLDFDNVIFLSLNEGQMPAPASSGSYLPFAIRKAYGLPTSDHRDAFYSYLFYRLLQRSVNVHFFYNTEPDIVGNGEISRFVQQLRLESGLEIHEQVLHSPVHVHQRREIEVTKTLEVMAQLNKYVPAVNPEARALSPSNLNDYLDCGLRFYLKHVAGLKEPEKVDENVDGRVFGNIVHNSIFWFYEDLKKKKKNGVIEASDLVNQENAIELLIDRAFRVLYDLGEKEKVVYEGQRVIVKEIAKTFLLQILKKDAAYAPFEVGMLEETFSHDVKVQGGRIVRIGGKIDRTDRKDDVVRLIDYKTGKDESAFESVESLFKPDAKRNRAAFQTFHYAYAFQLAAKDPSLKLMPGLVNRKDLFSEGSFGHTMGRSKTLLADVSFLLPEFGKLLEEKVNEIFDPAKPFTQTTYTPTCEYCPYKAMCRR